MNSISATRRAISARRRLVCPLCIINLNSMLLIVSSAKCGKLFTNGSSIIAAIITYGLGRCM